MGSDARPPRLRTGAPRDPTRSDAHEIGSRLPVVVRSGVASAVQRLHLGPTREPAQLPTPQWADRRWRVQRGLVRASPLHISSSRGQSAAEQTSGTCSRLCLTGRATKRTAIGVVVRLVVAGPTHCSEFRSKSSRATPQRTSPPARDVRAGLETSQPVSCRVLRQPELAALW